MCGIWCSIGFPPDERHLDLVSHRGPDGRGWRVLRSHAGPVVLGHRRLAILDTTDAAAQPMVYGNGRLWLVYNGEIYNYLELREELQGHGHSFTTRSDSEVLLAAYQEWGEACLDRFVGMFAFVLYEPTRDFIFAARDRFGIKPLYYVNNRHGIAFASEIKQFLGLPGFTARVNIHRAYDYLAAGMTDHTDQTLFDAVCQVRSSECVGISLAQHRAGTPIPLRKWYKLPVSGSLDIAEEPAAKRFQELLSESVRLHLRSDVPVGSCLSGGLDSSSIVCLIDRQLRGEHSLNRLQTISACYQDKSVDERPFMEAVADSTRTEPHYVFPNADDAMALGERITWHQDEPYGSTSIFAQWSVFSRAKQEHIKVMLDGQGADEQLAGYHSGFMYHYTTLLRRGHYVDFIRSVIERRRYHGVPVLKQIGAFVPKMLPGRLRQILLRQRHTFMWHDWLESEAFNGVAGSSPFDETLKREGLWPIKDLGDWCVALTQATNLPMLLRYEDRNSMAHGVEARVPFLDHRLVEFNISLGSRHKIVRSDTKRVLRLGMNGILPEKVRQRRDKLGFNTPEDAWFRGPLREAMFLAVGDTLQRYPSLFNRKGTLRLVEDMLQGRRPVDFALWRIVNLGLWGKCFSVSL